jgi:hypothetical protein
MDSLPRDILIIILKLILNYETHPSLVGNYVLVCKEWHNLIDSYDFNKFVFSTPDFISQDDWVALSYANPRFLNKKNSFRINLLWATQRLIPKYQLHLWKIITTYFIESLRDMRMFFSVVRKYNKVCDLTFSTPKPLWSIDSRLNWKYNESVHEWNYSKKLNLNYDSFKSSLPIPSLPIPSLPIPSLPIPSLPIGSEKSEKSEKSKETDATYINLLDYMIELDNVPYKIITTSVGISRWNINVSNNNNYVEHWELITDLLIYFIRSTNENNRVKYEEQAYNFICKYYPLINWGDNRIWKYIDQKFLEDHLTLCDLFHSQIWDSIIQYVVLNESFIENIVIKDIYIAKKIHINVYSIITNRIVTPGFIKRMKILFDEPSLVWYDSNVDHIKFILGKMDSELNEEFLDGLQLFDS